MRNKRQLINEELNKMKHLMGYKIGTIITEDDAIVGNKGVVGLSQIKPDLATAVIGSGVEDGDKGDDAVSGGKTDIAVGALKPAQTEIIKEKAFGMAIGLLLDNKWTGADLGNIVSQDKYIMDGHHRWAAISLIDPSASVKVTKIDLPGKALVTTLNLYTVGKFGKTTGNQGKGNVAEFTGQNFDPIIKQALEKGIGGDYPKTPEQVKEALGKMPGANGDVNAGAEIMKGNADKLPKEKMQDAPARVEMPVIDKEQVAIVQKQLAAGMADIKPPYSADVKAALGGGGETPPAEG